MPGFVALVTTTPGTPAPTAGNQLNAMLQELYSRSPGVLLSYSSPAGANNNVTPVGFGSTIGRLEVTLSANTNWTGLVAGQDGQQLIISVVAGAFVLTLNALNGGSVAANQFRAAGDLTIPLNNSQQLVYYGGSVNKWVVVP